MSRHDLTWLGWLFAAVGVFAWLERQALKSGSPTLSVELRGWLGIAPANPNRNVAKVWFAATVLWFLGHILFGDRDGMRVLPQADPRHQPIR